LFRLIPFDQNRRFWKDLKTAKNSLFDLIREFSKCSKILVSDQNQQSAPKIHQFWDFLWNFFQKNFFLEKMTIFGHFFSFSLLSYIEIYKEYSGNLKQKFAIVKLRKKVRKKITVLLGS
jgi:hypothetical protein